MSSLLDDFNRDETVSHVAKQHDVIKIDVQPKGLLTLQSLLTCNQQSSSRHAKNTPLSSHPTASQPTDEVEILGSRTLPFSGQLQSKNECVGDKVQRGAHFLLRILRTIIFDVRHKFKNE